MLRRNFFSSQKNFTDWIGKIGHLLLGVHVQYSCTLCNSLYVAPWEPRSPESPKPWIVTLPRLDGMSLFVEREASFFKMGSTKNCTREEKTKNESVTETLLTCKHIWKCEDTARDAFYRRCPKRHLPHGPFKNILFILDQCQLKTNKGMKNAKQITVKPFARRCNFLNRLPTISCFLKTPLELWKWKSGSSIHRHIISSSLSCCTCLTCCWDRIFLKCKQLVSVKGWNTISDGKSTPSSKSIFGSKFWKISANFQISRLRISK